MTAGTAPLTEHQAWKALAAHHKHVCELHLRKLFADDPTRGEADFQDKLLSAMRYEFGGHLEKSET